MRHRQLLRSPSLYAGLAIMMAIGCQSPVGNDADCDPLAHLEGASYSPAHSIGDDATDWHTAIDSLVATVPGDSTREGLAYHYGDSGEELAEKLDSIGFESRLVFESFAGVSFRGDVSLFPELKEIGLIYALYIGNPENRAWRTTCS